MIYTVEFTCSNCVDCSMEIEAADLETVKKAVNQWRVLKIRHTNNTIRVTKISPVTPLTKQQIIGSDLPQFNATAPKAPRAKVKALYAFTFIGGGFNHVWAFTKAGAIEQARKELPALANQIEKNSFKRITGEKAIAAYHRRNWTD